MLASHGLRAEHYHAGLEANERSRVQDEFVSGATQVVVATTAFGMGIDKPDVRLVALASYPSSLEEYVQMIGRVLYNEFNANVDWPVASAVAMVLLVVLVVPMMIYQHIQGKETGA